MSKDHIKAETRFDELSGAVSLNFHDKEDFKNFAATVGKVDVNRFNPVGFRAYYHHELIITIYAVDKQLQQEFTVQKGKLPVHKFKVEVPVNKLFSYIKQLDFTMVKENINVEDFEILN